AMRDVKLVPAGAEGAHRLEPVAARRDFHDARVAVAIRDIDVVLRIPAHVGGAVEGARGPDRMGGPVPAGGGILDAAVVPGPAVLEELLQIVDRLRGAAILAHRLTLRVVFDDHPR